MSFVTTFIPFLVVRNPNVPLIIGFSSPWNFNRFSDIVMMTGGGLPTAFGTEICCWTPFSPAEIVSTSSGGAQSSFLLGSLASSSPPVPPVPWTRGFLADFGPPSSEDDKVFSGYQPR